MAGRLEPLKTESLGAVVEAEDAEGSEGEWFVPLSVGVRGGKGFPIKIRVIILCKKW